MKRKFFLRGAILAMSILASLPLASFGAAPAIAQDVRVPAPPRQLSFAERVAYQYAIEEVYWRHRIWPKENPGPKPSLDAVMSAAQIEKKVEDYLRNSQLLADQWQRPITPEQLQAEMERMASQTKQPEVLQELFAALGNDSFVTAECLARPALSERLLRNWYAYDERIHGEIKKRAEVDLRAHNTVEQMKQTSGKYSEIELVRSDSVEDEKSTGALSIREWNQVVQKLAAIFRGANNENTRSASLRPSVAEANSLVQGVRVTQIKTGVLSPLQEDATRYYATAVVEKTEGRLKLATMVWPKEPLESWIARVEGQLCESTIAVSTGYTLPAIGADACSDNTWTNTYAGPAGRIWHTALWTGNEMIVWGGSEGGADIATGWRYNPSTDTWVPTSMTNSASPRSFHTAVWTGSEMIIWGGQYNTSYLSGGGRYNPSTDSWTGMNGGLSPRVSHTAVWTGGEMIIWGGYSGTDLNTGGKYNPNTDNWIVTSTTNAPSARDSHTAIWNGSDMIIWGGVGNSARLNTGGKYNPLTNSWTATNITNAPSARDSHAAIWSGSQMIVWGGKDNDFAPPLNTGGRYDPHTDSWTAVNVTNAPGARSSHTAVWTGSEMIVWGGDGATAYLNSGGKYNPSTDSWTATNPTNAPVGRDDHTAIWTGNEMIVWGGFTWPQGQLNTGGRYNPATDSWTNTASAPKQRDSHTAVWTGSEMIVWGGIDNFQAFQDTGGRYNPSTDSWIATSMINAPTARDSHTAVWTGNEMIVWGGEDNQINRLNSGGRYNPSTGIWTSTSATNAPEGRYGQAAVWTGNEMVVWGGYGGTFGQTRPLNTGGKYNPGTDSWIATSLTNAPSARPAKAVWTGDAMILWGGCAYSGGYQCFNTGAKYNPNTDTWAALNTANAPEARSGHALVWTGSEIIVWGGSDYSSGTYFNTGGKYSPATDTWTASSLTNVPIARFRHAGVWTGTELIVWGGVDVSSSLVNSGGRYNPSTDSWSATTISNAPTPRDYFTAVWTGTNMIVWGGTNDHDTDYNTGGRYCAQPSAPVVQNAVSRKAHGVLGAFDVDLPLAGTPGIECRTGGGSNDYNVLITFSANVSVNGDPQAAVTSGIGTIGSGGVSNGGRVNIAGNIVTVPLTSVANAQTITVTLYGVNGPTNVAIPMSILVGDTNANGMVNSGDVAQTKARLGQALDATNFRSDVNANGAINAGDVSQIKSLLGTGLP